ncbi:anti-sigma factor [Neisseriaceae bacterium TC5R-5]|nr:anti-sigma factor [Neisseriaceae bacterium TC5R-5]
MNSLPITEADLQAYVDGLLPESRRAEIETYLSERPQEAQRLQAYQQDKQAIKALYRSLLDKPVPDSLLQAARAPRSSATARYAGARLPRWSLERVAAGFALVFLGAGAGWLGRGAWQPPEILAQSTRGPAAIVNAAAGSLPHQAAIAHVVYSPDVRRPVEIGADQEDQLVAWLSKRLGAKIRPPKLGALGYELIGGRLLPGSSGPVAQFMYHDATGQRLTLYVTNEQTANQSTGFRFAQEGPVNVFYWIDGKFGYALSAGINRGELGRIATAVYSQLQLS